MFKANEPLRRQCMAYARGGEVQNNLESQWFIRRALEAAGGEQPLKVKDSERMSKFLYASCLFLALARVCGGSSFEFVLQKTAANSQQFCRLSLNALASGHSTLDQVGFNRLQGG